MLDAFYRCSGVDVVGLVQEDGQPENQVIVKQMSCRRMWMWRTFWFARLQRPLAYDPMGGGGFRGAL